MDILLIILVTSVLLTAIIFFMRQHDVARAAKHQADGELHAELHDGNEVTLKLEDGEDAEDLLSSFVNDDIGIFIETVGGVFIRTSEIKTLQVKSAAA